MELVNRNFDGRFPSFRRPELIGYYSLNHQRSFCHDLSQLKYIDCPYKLKEVRFDLNHRIDETMKKIETNEKLDNMLKWILETYGKPLESTVTDVVCYRGLLRLLMCTPYENKEGWIINATKFKGVVYLCESETPAAKQKKQCPTPQEQTFTSWGYKFEQYMVSDQPDEQPNGLEPNSENEEFCIMLTTKLNSHTILYGAEIDAVESKSRINSLEELKKVPIVELKTSREISHERQYMNFARHKLRKWWCQSFLIGVNKILCGFRNDRGVVHCVKTMTVSNFPKESDWWDSAVCMDYCDRFLNLVRSVVTEESPETVWKFEWHPQGNKKVTYSQISGLSEYTFLHKWYTSSLKT